MRNRNNNKWFSVSLFPFDFCRANLLVWILLRSSHNQIGWLRFKHFVRFYYFTGFVGIPSQHQRQIGQQTHLGEIFQCIVWILEGIEKSIEKLIDWLKWIWLDSGAYLCVHLHEQHTQFETFSQLLKAIVNVVRIQLMVSEREIQNACRYTDYIIWNNAVVELPRHVWNGFQYWISPLLRIH